MKKIILIIIFCIFSLTGGVIFIKQNFSSTRIENRNFIVIKGYGENLYPYRLTFPKGTTALEIITFLEDDYKKPKKIFIKKSTHWTGVTDGTKIYYDTTIKAEF